MEIYLKTAAGRTYTLEVDENWTIGDLKQHLQGKSGIQAERVRLIYAGKQLEDGHTLGHYNIQMGSTLHMVLRLSSSGNGGRYRVITEETTFPTASSSDETFSAWESIAEEGDFNADLHIVDPQAHYDRLAHIERDVITVSEFYHCGGSYEKTGVDNRVPGENSSMPRLFFLGISDTTATLQYHGYRL